MSSRVIEENMFSKYSIVDHATPEGVQIHEFLAKRAKALASKYIDFDKTPVTFVLADSDQPNAFYAPLFDPENVPKGSSYETTRYVKNPLETPIICVTRGLIEMADNLDQLDFVLGHELTHMIMSQYDIKHNSKGEEEFADLHATDLMYDAGGDPKQALLMSQKIGIYATEQKAKTKHRRRNSRDANAGIDWSEILDVYMSHDNRKAGIEASLTRLSHLIDNRKPTALDKAPFNTSYSDPVTAFLKAQNYEKKPPFTQLKILVDCIDHISAPVPAAVYVQAQMDALPKLGPDQYDWRTNQKRKSLQEHIQAGYPHYFSGPLIDKKYQQKIALLAEDVINKVIAKQKEKREKAEAAAAEKAKAEGKPLAKRADITSIFRQENTEVAAIINTQALTIHLQDKAYAHITAHDYPKVADINYLEASGVLYSYFYALFETHSPNARKNRRQPPQTAPTATKIERDLLAAQQKVITVKTAPAFVEAATKINKLTHILREIRSTEYGTSGRQDKLNNLSSLSGMFVGGRHSDAMSLYGEQKGGALLPWNNLAEIAKTDESTQHQVATFLKQNGIEDFRITHDLPYVRIGYDQCYRVTKTGNLFKRKIPEYQLDFIVHKPLVKQAYDYMTKYFDGEDALIDASCATALNIADQDYQTPATATERSNDNSLAHKKIYDFVSLFNALPDEEEEGRYRDNSALSLIPERYQEEHPLPGRPPKETQYSRQPALPYDEKLLNFDNPIFKKHFGKDFEASLTAKKQAQQQKLFDTAFTILQASMERWLKVSPKVAKLHAKRQKSWDADREEISPTERKLIRAQQNIIAQELDIHRKEESETSSIVHHFLYSIVSERDSWYELQRLKPEQKRMLAEYAVKDETGGVLKMIRAEGYEFFCDYLGILKEQTDRAIAGNFELTDMMQIVVDRYGYKPATTRKELSAFVKKQDDKRYSRDHREYTWHLHVFDSMKYLQNTASIDVYSLSTALTNLVYKSSCTASNKSYKIESERKANYTSFIKNSQILALVTKAVDHADNYKGLSCKALLNTADSLIAMRNAMATEFSEDKQKSSIHPNKSILTTQEQNFLDVVDKNIKTIVKKAEALSLKKRNPLTKMTDLFRVYNQYQNMYSYKDERKKYIEEDRAKIIENMAQNKNFWPVDVLDHIKAFVMAKNTFLDDKEIEDNILNDMLNKLEILPASKKKNQCLHILLDKNLRAAYPETRARLFTIYTDDISHKLGMDDGSEKFQNRLGTYLNVLADDTPKDWDIGKKHGYKEGLLANAMSSADKYILLRQLSDELVTQEQTSQIIKEQCQIKLNSDDMLRSYLHGIGVDYLTAEMDSDPEFAKKFIQFFNSKGEKDNCEELSQYIETAMRKKYEKWNDHLNKAVEQTRPSNCKVLYENFWAAPLEARSVIIARMLKSAVNKTENGTETEQPTAQSIEQKEDTSWEPVFNLVMDNVISPDDNSVEAQYAQDIMHSYIKSRSDYERVLILSAMMVANRNIGENTGNIGKALKLFLENMGPAEIKLGQAISSHPDTPLSIKTELQQLKSSADIPARWTLYDWIKTENIPENLWKNKRLGKILGSASYYTSVALGDDKVLRILRPEAREKADKGFRTIGLTIEDLKTKEEQSDRSYKELTSSVQEMVIQAAHMSDIETDHDLGQQQYEYAKSIYDNVTLNTGSQSFTLKVMDWRAKGKNWIIMDRAPGPTFNDIPEKTTQQIERKRQFARGYVTFEMMTMLSGKKFDHDRHGAQLSIDPKTNAAGIYDTGAMAINDPSAEEQKQLGRIVYAVIKNVQKGNDLPSSFNHIIGEKIADLHATGQSTQYLVEVKKGLLALGDFFRLLDQQDIKDIMMTITASNQLSKDINEGMIENMSLLEQAQFKAFMAVQSASASNMVEKSTTKGSQVTVQHVTNMPSIVPKSIWLEQAFTKANDDPQSKKPTARRSSSKPRPS